MADPSSTYGAPAAASPYGAAAPVPGAGGYGAPPGGSSGFGAAPAQSFGAPDAFGGPQQSYGTPPPQHGFGSAPPQQSYGGPQSGYDAQNPAAMQLAGGANMNPYGQPGQPGSMGAAGGGGGMLPGGNGPKGQVRNGTQVLLYSFLSCGIYQVIWFISICGEMSAFLKRDEPSWLKVLLFSTLTCNIYGLYWFAVKLGALIAEVQQRAGVQNPQNLGWMYLIPYYNIILIQEELNKAWQLPG